MGTGASGVHVLGMPVSLPRLSATAEEAAPRGASISTLLFIVGEVILLAVTQAVGGTPWTLVAMAALIPLGFLRPDVVTIALAATCLAWPAATRATGNRELFFLFAMQLAAVVVCRGGRPGAVRAIVGGAAVVAAFLGVRLWQAATPRVLAVETIVAVVILAGSVGARIRASPGWAAEAATVAAASLAAYAGLAL
jgi:hypothetical protein